MGNIISGESNLTSLQWPDVSKDVISPSDQFAEVLLGAMWLGALYGIGIIFSTVTLLGRWAGPHGERGFNLFSILGAVLISTAWPLVLVYLLMHGD